VVAVRSVRKPWWQQATALVTVSAGGVITGFNFVPGAAETMTSPTSVPLHLLALERAAQPGTPGDLAVGGDSAARVTSDASLRAAIVNVAGYYLRLAESRTPSQMAALIWDDTSVDGTDHGPSCAAFASLTLELAAQAVGQQSWVTGGASYPWPLPEWADVRVDTNPASPGVTSMVADAQAHGRWHPLGDGYRPQPGDWALYEGHVEVVTGYAGGVLDTIGADSLPGLTVNAHSSGAPLADQGVTGFVDNGSLTAAAGALGSSSSAVTRAPAHKAATPAPTGASAAIPGILAAGALPETGVGPAAEAAPQADRAPARAGSGATVPGVLATGDLLGRTGTTPGATPATAPTAARPATEPSSEPRARPSAQPTAPAASPSSPAAAPAATPSSPAGRQYATPGTRDQQAFISLVAPGAIAAQQRFGVPAAVTIAQAIEESAWGRSGLAAQYHNLFGVKGTGPAGSVSLPTSEYQGGHWVTIDAQFRAYHNDAESVADHAELLATSGYYTRAMADRTVPDAFANDLTGVYATDPEYGSNLIALMRLYNLYQFDGTGASAPAPAPATRTPTASPSPTVAPPSHGRTASASPSATGHPAATPTSSPSATPTRQAGSGQAGAWHAHVPGVAAPTLAPATPPVTPGTPGAAGTTAAISGHIPGLVSPGPLTPTSSSAAAGRTTPARATAARTASRPSAGVATSAGIVTTARVTRGAVAAGPARYRAQLPHAVTTALFANAKAPLARGEHLYRDVAACTGIGWELLAAVDWMQCKAGPRHSPVHGEKIGSLNDDGTSYPTKSAALTQCACDLIELAAAVYGIDLTTRRRLSVRELAAAFAAFRWGAILRRKGVSAMEFPYSVAGLTAQHQKMHWPPIDAPGAPDRPGGRFREPFGAVPVVLSLDYPATV
jgi:flagellum-specific peptidoglycan hydrolase FlgJ